MVPRLDEPAVVKLYLDREGYLYPPEAHVTPHYFYLQHQRGVKHNQNNPEFATIEYALKKNDSLTTAFIRQRYGLQGTDSVRFFIRLQNSLRRNVLNRINNSVQQSGSKQVVVLIHGFNDPSPDAYYFSLRRAIAEHLKFNPTFVEVYWDGLTSLGFNPAVAGIWGKARINSAKVGLGLRQVLNGLDPGVQLTIITHSLGASVAAHTLFNPVKWPTEFQEKLEVEYQSGSIPTPVCQTIQLGMLAPAISGTQVFDDVLNTVPREKKPRLKKIVVGYNHYDYAVTKGGFMAKAFGNTALGADAANEVKKTFDTIQQQSKEILCKSIDFSYSVKLGKDTLPRKTLRKLRQSEHAILFYQQNVHFPEFLNALFN
jgi:hypothetical protein